jgi:hypothetical protein
MNPRMLKALRMMEASAPASGQRPETPEEWKRAIEAGVELGYAMLRDSGYPKQKARVMAKQIWGGEAGMLMLTHAFSEVRDE